MLAAFIQMNNKHTSIQSVQADQIGRTYPVLFILNLPKEDEIIDDLKQKLRQWNMLYRLL